MQLTQNLLEALRKFEKEPDRKTLIATTSFLNGLIGKSQFDSAAIDAIQVHPALWSKVQTGSGVDSDVRVSIIRRDRTMAPAGFELASERLTITILYFAAPF
jgi:hypothetical protein